MLVVRALPAPAPSGTHLSVAPDRLAHICAGTRPHPRRDSQIRHGLDLSKYDVTRTRAFPLTGEHVRPKSHLQEQWALRLAGLFVGSPLRFGETCAESFGPSLWNHGASRASGSRRFAVRPRTLAGARNAAGMNATRSSSGASAGSCTRKTPSRSCSLRRRAVPPSADAAPPRRAAVRCAADSRSMAYRRLGARTGARRSQPASPAGSSGCAFDVCLSCALVACRSMRMQRCPSDRRHAPQPPAARPAGARPRHPRVRAAWCLCASGRGRGCRAVTGALQALLERFVRDRRRRPAARRRSVRRSDAGRRRAAARVGLTPTGPHLHRDWGSPLPHLRRDWGSPLPHLRRDWGSPLPHLHRDWGSPGRICAAGCSALALVTSAALGTSAPRLGLAVAVSALGLGSPLPHLHRDRAHPCHICTGTRLCAGRGTTSRSC